MFAMMAGGGGGIHYMTTLVGGWGGIKATTGAKLSKNRNVLLLDNSIIYQVLFLRQKAFSFIVKDNRKHFDKNGTKIVYTYEKLIK